MSARELTAALVAIDSVNPALVEGGAGEAEIAAFVAGWLREAGLEVEREEVAPGRPNVVGILRGSGGGPSLMLNAHLDTVGVEGMARPFSPEVRDGRLYGRGAYDMKGSLAACMLAARRLAADPPQGDVLLTAVADEEHASLGTQAVLRRHRADAAIVTEPTGLRLCVAHKGFVWADVETTGRAAHGSRPDEGVDAITRMAPVLGRLAALQQRFTPVAGGPPLGWAEGADPVVARHPLLGAPSLHASLIEGGQERSSYPARCVLALERRTLPGETAHDVRRECDALIDGVDGARVTMGLVREPFEAPAGARVVEAAARAIEATCGGPPERYGDTFWMDAALIQAAGIPTVVLGPGGAGAHATDEWVDLESVEACARVLEAAARELCAA